MASADKGRLRLEALDERLAKLRTQRVRFATRLTRAERQRDANRKILIGAAVLAAIEQDGVPAFHTQSDLLGWLDGRLNRAADRSVFELAPRNTEES